MATWENKFEVAVIAPRLRALIGQRPTLTEKPMFGGICFLLAGNMLCGAGKNGFMFRVDPSAADMAARLPGAEPMVMGERSMRGFYWVDAHACDDAGLCGWLALAESYVGKMPAKAKRK